MLDLCHQTWRTIGVKRFPYAYIRYICPQIVSITRPLCTRNPRHESDDDPEPHVTIFFKTDKKKTTSSWCHIKCTEDYKFEKFTIGDEGEDSEKTRIGIEKSYKAGEYMKCMYALFGESESIVHITKSLLKWNIWWVRLRMLLFWSVKTKNESERL